MYFVHLPPRHVPVRDVDQYGHGSGNDRLVEHIGATSWSFSETCVLTRVVPQHNFHVADTIDSQHVPELDITGYCAAIIYAPIQPQSF